MKNNSHTVAGFLVSVEAAPTQRGSVSVRKFVVKTNEEYPQLLEFELINKNTGIVDGVATGQEMNVSFSLRGREYNGRVFHNLSAFRVEPLKSSVAPKAQPAKQKPAAAAAPTAPESEDVPF